MFLQQLDSHGDSFRHCCKNNLRSKRSCAFLGKGKPRNLFTSFLVLLSPHFSHGQNAENPVLRSLLHGNACYTGYCYKIKMLQIALLQLRLEMKNNNKVPFFTA